MGFSKLFFAALALLLIWLSWFFWTMPEADSLRGCLRTTMFEIELCPKSKGYVRLGAISKHLRNAILVSEDSSFYQHSGIDWFELEESLRLNWEKSRVVRGASTITQQLAKNVFLSEERSLLRKIREAILAVQIEGVLEKDEILERYLNIIEFAPKIYGVGAAANYFFGKTPAQVNPLEASYLAHLLPNPRVYSRTHQKGSLTDFSKKRVEETLIKLLSFQHITDMEFAYYSARIGEFPWLGLTEPNFEPSVEPENITE